MTFNVWIDNQLLSAHATMLRVHAIAAERDVAALLAQNAADITDHNAKLFELRFQVSLDLPPLWRVLTMTLKFEIDQSSATVDLTMC
jgi:hypothetical protein